MQRFCMESNQDCLWCVLSFFPRAWRKSTPLVIEQLTLEVKSAEALELWLMLFHTTWAYTQACKFGASSEKIWILTYEYMYNW